MRRVVIGLLALMLGAFAWKTRSKAIDRDFYEDMQRDDFLWSVLSGGEDR